MTEETQALVDQLEAIAARFDMTATERYEQDSEAFYAATGYMAPGKDVPMAMGGQDEGERRSAHEAWIAERNRQQRDGLRDAAAALTALSRDLETARQEREAALAEDTRKLLLMTVAKHECDAAVRAARAETWAEAAAWHEGMAESSVIPSLRPLHQQYAANFRERARLAAREEQ